MQTLPATAADLAAARSIPHVRGMADVIAMANKPGCTWRPTLRADLIGKRRVKLIGDAFDAAMEAAGDDRRAYRC